MAVQDLPSAGRQRGAALMIMLLILVLGAAALFVRDLSARGPAAARAAKSAQALAEAKEALLGAIVTADAASPGRYGLLPCPDVDTTGGFAEGEAHAGACLARYRNVLGRFPWRTLGVEPGRAAGGECLWYAVSGGWKAATAALPEMANTDTSGSFRVFARDGATLLAGATPAGRAVAVIIAPGPPLAGQVRTQPATGVEQCGGNYTANAWMERDAAAGIDNRNVAAAADAIDDFIAGEPGSDTLNDQLIYITRAEVEERLLARADVQAALTGLTRAVAECVADYGRHNAAGAGDRRLPWPAPVDLAVYRVDAQYDDAPAGALMGRVPNRVNDSNARTGNTSAGVLTACSAAAVPAWNATMLTLWRNWKDHLFYAVAGSFHPNAAPHSSCGTCLQVNGAGTWAGVVVFAGSRLAAAGQVRDEPPMDADTRGAVASYLEGRNAAAYPNAAGDADLESAAAGPAFNDVLFCIDANLAVSPC